MLRLSGKAESNIVVLSLTIHSQRFVYLFDYSNVAPVKTQIRFRRTEAFSELATLENTSICHMSPRCPLVSPMCRSHLLLTLIHPGQVRLAGAVNFSLMVSHV